MVEDWSRMIAEMDKAVANLRVASPEVMKGFSALARAANTGSALDGKTRELITLAIAVAVRCAPCVAYHVQGALKKGATREEIAETMGLAVYMGAGPSVMYAAQALEAVDQLAAAS